jgi:signal transduction histidine kinase
VEFIARTQANLHLADQYSEVKKLNDSKDQIFSIISHDLREPVGAIKALTDSVINNKRSYEEEKMFKLFKDINKQISSTFYILENLLLWAQSQRKIISVELGSFLVNHAVKANIQVLEKAATNKEIYIENNIPEDLEAYYDVNLISIVVRNLIANAIKFTPFGGKISIDIASEATFHTISVNDTGIGVSPERIPKLFDKSVFETTYGTNKEKGSGIGLKLCKDFVEKHQGTIGVNSVVNKGSSFWFTLPIVN